MAINGKSRNYKIIAVFLLLKKKVEEEFLLLEIIQILAQQLNMSKREVGDLVGNERDLRALKHDAVKYQECQLEIKKHQDTIAKLEAQLTLQQNRNEELRQIIQELKAELQIKELDKQRILKEEQERLDTEKAENKLRFDEIKKTCEELLEQLQITACNLEKKERELQEGLAREKVLRDKLLEEIRQLTVKNDVLMNQHAVQLEQLNMKIESLNGKFDEQSQQSVQLNSKLVEQTCEIKHLHSKIDSILEYVQAQPAQRQQVKSVEEEKVTECDGGNDVGMLKQKIEFLQNNLLTFEREARHGSKVDQRDRLRRFLAGVGRLFTCQWVPYYNSH